MKKRWPLRRKTQSMWNKIFSFSSFPYSISLVFFSFLFTHCVRHWDQCSSGQRQFSILCFFFFFWFDFICIVVYYSVGWDLIFTWCPEHIVPFGRRSRYGLCIGHEVRGPHLDSDGKNDALYALHGAHNVADIEGIGGIGGIGGSTFGGIAVTPTLPRITHIYNMSDYSDHNLKIAIILCGVREFNRSFLLLGIFLVFYSFSFLSKYAIFV